MLDPRLAADSIVVATLALCEVRLMNDTRFPWLLLVPQRPGCVEIDDLDLADQHALWAEVRRCSASLRSIAPCDKLNLGALGNIVRQLHVHLVARTIGDAAWPGPVWGSGAAQPYEAAALAARVADLRTSLAQEHR